jgi:hypothetical protein
MHPDGPGAPESKPAKVISLGRSYFRITVIRIPKISLPIIHLHHAKEKLERHRDDRRLVCRNTVWHRHTTFNEHAHIHLRGLRDRSEHLIF